MKNLILGFLFSFLFSSNCFSQTINGIPFEEINTEHILIVGTHKLIGNKVIIELDFGQETKLFRVKERILLDEENKPVKFNSMIDALNFMSKAGYSFIDAYAITNGTSNIYHWLVGRDKDE